MLTSIGKFLIQIAGMIQLVAGYVYLALIIGVVIALLLKWICDLLKLSPFSRFSYYASRPANQMLHKMRNSALYFPLKRALNFDPAILMILVGTAVLCYLIATIIDDFTIVLSGLGRSLIAFGVGQVFTGIRFLTGTILLALIFFLLALMTIVFLNWIFGWMNKLAFRAYQRISPLLRFFEFGGTFAGMSFLLLGLALSLAAAAVQRIFLMQN